MGVYKGFTSVELKRPTRSNFDLSHEKRVSGRIGKLIPIFVSETMPNDTFYVSSEVLVKLAPMIAPIYHRLNLYVHYFFIPNRLLWVDWEDFITGGRLGEAVTTPPVPPYRILQPLIGDGYFEVGKLPDYFGCPIIPTADAATWGNRTIDAMPFAAFYKVWYDYYRDRNYVADNTDLPLASGAMADNGSVFDMRVRGWQHDYFTSAQLTAQRGAEVLMPLQGTGTVTYLDQSLFQLSAGGDVSGAVTAQALSPVGGLEVAGQDSQLQNIDEVVISNSEVSINDLRRANRLQEWLERNQLAGSRYNESIMAHFGRRTSDGRLQRAEYLGGGKAVIQISEVMTTAYSEDSDTNVVPPGNPAGRGSTYANTNSFSYNCEEHGFVLGILSVMPTSAYMQGIPRMFQNRNTFLDYPWPSFAHLGEQPVYDNEVYADPSSMPIDRTTQPQFGYQSRYADWKYIPSTSHGDFRSTLEMWHLTRKFASQPVLDNDFVRFEDELQDRIFNVADVDTLWMYIYNKVNVKRALPYFGTPRS